MTALCQQGCKKIFFLIYYATNQDTMLSVFVMKPMLKYLAFGCLFLLVFNTTWAQRVFQKRVIGDLQNNYVISTHAPTSENGLWVLGKNSFTGGTARNYIIKTDSLGDTLFVKQHITVKRVGFNSLVSAPDGGVYIVGTSDAPTGAIREYLFVAKLDSDGNLEWAKSYSGESYSSPVACLHNNTLHIGGLMRGAFSSNDGLLYLIRLDKDGTLLSSDFRRAPNKESISDIAVTPSGFTVMSGVTYINNNLGNPLMVSADPGGNLRYYNELSFSSGVPTYGSAEGIAVIGNEVWLTGNVFGSQNGGRIFVARINGPLSIDAQFSLVSHNFDVFAQAITSKLAGGILIIGGTVVIDSNGKSKKLLIGCKSDFSIEWAKGYGDGKGGNQLSELNIMPNDDIIATGRIAQNHFYGIDIIRSDIRGNTGCDESTYNLSNTSSNQLLVTRYMPDGFAATVQTLNEGAIFNNVSFFDITKTCDFDSCKANFTLSKDTLCANTCITITDSSKNAISWSWSFENGSPNTLSVQNPNQVCFTTTGTKTVKLVVSNTTNSDSIEKAVYVHSSPKAEAGNDTVICRGKQIRLQGSGGLSYLWEPNDFKNSPSLPNPRVTPDSTIRYFLTVLDSNKCEDKDSVLVSIIQPPVTVTVDSTICDDKTITVNAQNTGFSYLWSTGTTNAITTLDTGKHFVILSNSCFTDTSYFTITGKDCNPLYYIPTAFSPNGDGLNDVFSVYGDNIANIEMTIYNRWGEVLFKDKGANPTWKGGYKNAICPSNQYLYIIVLQDHTGKKYNEKGTITLLR